MEKQQCVICGLEFSEYGNNPFPIFEPDEGQCCDDCDRCVVSPVRLTISTLVYQREQAVK